jgi:hypothetical protein
MVLAGKGLGDSLTQLRGRRDVAAQIGRLLAVRQRLRHSPGAKVLSAAGDKPVDQDVQQLLGLAMASQIRVGQKLAGFVQPPASQGRLGLFDSQDQHLGHSNSAITLTDPNPKFEFRNLPAGRQVLNKQPNSNHQMIETSPIGPFCVSRHKVTHWQGFEFRFWCFEFVSKFVLRA